VARGICNRNRIMTGLRFLFRVTLRRLDLAAEIRLPAALPSIFGGLKVGISLAVIGAVIGEYVAAEHGLGYLQLQASSQLDTTLSFASLLIIAGMGVVTFWALEVVERHAVFQREVAK
jgi:NitT/TauT family transport system permease protein